MCRFQKRSYFLSSIVSLTLALATLLCLVLAFPMTAVANTQSADITSLEPKDSVTSKISIVNLAQVPKQAAEPPRRRGRGGNWWNRLIGLGRRGSCSRLRLVTLSPICSEGEDCSAEALEDREANSIVHGITLTGSSNPAFWFYLSTSETTVASSDNTIRSVSSEKIEYAEFMLQDEYGEDAIEEPLLLAFEEPLLATSDAHAKLISFQWPQEKSPLKVGHLYHWYFSILCNVERPSRNLAVDDWIERVNFKEEQVENLTLEDKLEIYSERGLWNETITDLVTESCEGGSLDELTDNWGVLLTETSANSDVASVIRELDKYCDKPQRLIPVS